MKSLPIAFLLLLSLSSFDGQINEPKTEQQVLAQDTTSARTWKRKAEESEQYARMHKKMAEKMAAEVAGLKRRLEECERGQKN